MGALLQDLRYALRQFQKTPALTSIVVLTIALGVGANTALFSVINGVLLSPLSYPHPEELVTLHESKVNFQTGAISFPNFRDWKRSNHTFSDMAIARPATFNLTGAGDAAQVNGEYVTSDFFSILDIKPVLGRTFANGEDEVGASPVVLISESLWRERFGAAPDVAGKSLTLDGRIYAVLGVIPSAFHFPMAPYALRRDAYVPVGQWKNNLLNTRSAGLGFHGIGRLKPGVTLEQATADLNAVASSLATAYPDANTGIGAKLIPMKQWMVGGVRPLLLVLFASVGLVLLIVCVNVANLLLARSIARTREFAIRGALGATRSRVIRQLLTESLLLGFSGGALGLLLAGWGTQTALAFLPTALPRIEEVALDARVLIFTILISAFTGVLVGLVPAIKTKPSGIADALKEAGYGSTGSRHRLQGIFVVAEIAMALVLVAGAGLLIRSLQHLWGVDPGFRAENVLTVGVSLPPSFMTAKPEAIRNAFREFDEKITATPGVQAVSQTWGALPMVGDDEQTFWFESESKPTSENEMKWALDYIVEPGYAKAMGLQLLQGRFFSDNDTERSPRVVVVDEVFAKAYFPHQDPIGKRIRSNNFEGTAEIVGVVGHVKQWGLDLDDSEKLRAQFYLPCSQMQDAFIAMIASGSAMVVRFDRTEAGMFESIRHSVQQISNEYVLFAPQTMHHIISDSLARRRFLMVLLGTFAALALLLAVVGIYGVTSYIVGLRRHEMAIRIALGAGRRDILLLILQGAGMLTAQGVVLGLLVSAGLTRLITSFLYGVGPGDPFTFTVVPMIVVAVALLASYLPARRAAAVDPSSALKGE